MADSPPTQPPYPDTPAGRQQWFNDLVKQIDEREANPPDTVAVIAHNRLAMFEAMRSEDGNELITDDELWKLARKSWPMP